jgi:DnaJ-class molecular chaperone
LNVPGTRYYGKILGALLGFALMRHPFGLLIGGLLGHALDSGWLQRRKTTASLDADYHQLGVSPEASDIEIEQAWRRLMATHHPDRVVGETEAVRAQAEERARAINTAYDRIMAARRRAD